MLLVNATSSQEPNESIPHSVHGTDFNNAANIELQFIVSHVFANFLAHIKYINNPLKCEHMQRDLIE